MSRAMVLEHACDHAKTSLQRLDRSVFGYADAEPPDCTRFGEQLPRVFGDRRRRFNMH